jgi:hypothetical protein
MPDRLGEVTPSPCSSSLPRAWRAEAGQALRTSSWAVPEAPEPAGRLAFAVEVPMRRPDPKPAPFQRGGSRRDLENYWMALTRDVRRELRHGSPRRGRCQRPVADVGLPWTEGPWPGVTPPDPLPRQHLRRPRRSVSVPVHVARHYVRRRAGQASHADAPFPRGRPYDELTRSGSPSERHMPSASSFRASLLFGRGQVVGQAPSPPAPDADVGRSGVPVGGTRPLAPSSARAISRSQQWASAPEWVTVARQEPAASRRHSSARATTLPLPLGARTRGVEPTLMDGLGTC